MDARTSYLKLHFSIPSMHSIVVGAGGTAGHWEYMGYVGFGDAPNTYMSCGDMNWPCDANTDIEEKWLSEA